MTIPDDAQSVYEDAVARGAGRNVAGQSSHDLRAARGQRPRRLSKRELQITQRVLNDYTVEAIAKDLGLSPATVRTHFRRLYRKVGVRSRVGLVRFALEELDVYIRADGVYDFRLTDKGRTRC